MPKASSSTLSTGKFEPFTIKHLTRTILVPRPRTYQAAAALVHKHFPSLRYKPFCFQTTQVDIAAGNAVELTDDAWEGIIDSITSVEVLKAEQGECTDFSRFPSPYRCIEAFGMRSEYVSSPSPPHVPLPDEPRITFRVRGFKEGSTDILVKARPTDKWSRLVKAWCAANHYKHARTLYVVLEGSSKSLKGKIGLDFDDIHEEQLVDLHKQQSKGKHARTADSDSDSEPESEHETPSEYLPSPSPPPADPTGGHIITFSVWATVDPTKRMVVKAKPSDTWARLVKAWCWANHYKRGDALRISHDGIPLERHAQIGRDPIFMDETQEIVLMPEQTGGKPVIYVWTPQPQAVSVHLKLSRQWRFSAVYPIACIEKTGLSSVGESVRWDVQTCADGNLVDTKTGLEVNSLFWEAKTTPVFEHLDSPPSSRPGTPGNEGAFDPTTANLTDADAVLLRVSDMTGYLDACLRALGLHTEARTSFITYWLPSFLQHEYIALRFVPQASYAAAARLTLVPAPDVVARIFMLFKGVAPGALGTWTRAAARAREDVGFWREVVGMGDAAQMCDRSLFRVLEWGGMEVLI